MPKFRFWLLKPMGLRLMALVSAVFGPLLLFGMMKTANGQPGTHGGIAMCMMAIRFSLVELFGGFNVHVRRKPLLRISQGELEVHLTGVSRRNGIDFFSGWIRLAWLKLRREGFKKPIGWLPQDAIRTIDVGGLPRIRTLLIDAPIAYPAFHSEHLTAKIGQTVVFCDGEFRGRLDNVDSTITRFSECPDRRQNLPGLLA